MDLSTRPIAMTDIETTGDIPGVHEILEIGLVLFDPITFIILDTLNIKVKPLHIENAVPAALERNGYKPEDWEGAVNLNKAMNLYSEKTKGAMFAAYNASFDWGFINEAFRSTSVVNQMDYHRLDVLTMAWMKGLMFSKSWSLKTACKLFGIPPEPEKHEALAGALIAYNLFKKIK